MGKSIVLSILLNFVGIDCVYCIRGNVVIFRWFPRSFANLSNILVAAVVMEFRDFCGLTHGILKINLSLLRL